MLTVNFGDRNVNLGIYLYCTKYKLDKILLLRLSYIYPKRKFHSISYLRLGIT